MQSFKLIVSFSLVTRLYLLNFLVGPSTKVRESICIIFFERLKRHIQFFILFVCFQWMPNNSNIFGLPLSRKLPLETDRRKGFSGKFFFLQKRKRRKRKLAFSSLFYYFFTFRKMYYRFLQFEKPRFCDF